jgi:hypothetical protein
VSYPSISVLMLQRKLAVMRDLPIDVMVANEPLSYREALAATLREVRPNVGTIVVAPDELDHATFLHKPRLIVCSQLTDTIENRPIAWALLYPEGASWSVLSLAGKRIRDTHIDLGQLLSLIDQAIIYGAGQSRGNGA